MSISQPPTSLTSFTNTVSDSQPAHHWLAPNLEIQLWVVTEKTSHCLWFPPSCFFQFYTQQWWEMNLPWLSLKGSAKQSSIRKSILCHRASVRHIPLCYSTGCFEEQKVCMSRVWMSKSKLENKNVTIMILSGNICVHNLKKQIIFLIMFKASY